MQSEKKTVTNTGKQRSQSGTMESRRRIEKCKEMQNCRDDDGVAASTRNTRRPTDRTFILNNISFEKQILQFYLLYFYNIYSVHCIKHLTNKPNKKAT